MSQKITVGYMRDLEKQVRNEEISYSRMVELLNEKIEQNGLTLIVYDIDDEALCPVPLYEEKNPAFIPMPQDDFKLPNNSTVTISGLTLNGEYYFVVGNNYDPHLKRINCKVKKYKRTYEGD